MKWYKNLKKYGGVLDFFDLCVQNLKLKIAQKITCIFTILTETLVSIMPYWEIKIAQCS